MSRSDDKVSVPTNGHRPALAATTAAAPDPATDAAATAPVRAGTSVPGERAGTDVTLALSPAQLAAGFGILAGLILLLLGRRRGRS